MSRYLAVRLSEEDYAAFAKYRLQVAAEIGRDIPAGKFVIMLTDIAKKHDAELTALAKSRGEKPS